MNVSITIDSMTLTGDQLEYLTDRLARAIEDQAKADIGGFKIIMKKGQKPVGRHLREFLIGTISIAFAEIAEDDCKAREAAP